jgi:proline iminopeptidase
MVPPQHRTDGSSVMTYYAHRMRDSDPATVRRFAAEWMLWELILTSIKYEPSDVENEVTGDNLEVGAALIETHYFQNGCFIPENHIIASISNIRRIPCSVIHGRFDMCTPPISAYDLAQTYGDNLTLRWVNAGHLRTDPEMLAELRSATNALKALDDGAANQPHGCPQ